MRVARNGQWLSAMLGEECVLMSTETGNYLTLSRVGARIWDLIAPAIDGAELCKRLIQEFEVSPEICQAEVDGFLADLVKRRAVTLSPP